MDLGLAGKRILVTGGALGIGGETVMAFARQELAS
jgi:NAD(P)-dependent dehydrogenase (short-subunit alcohol dehydrogenase family)